MAGIRRKKIEWKKAIILFEHLTYPSSIVCVALVSAQHEPFFVGGGVGTDLMLAAISIFIRPPVTERSAAPPQRAEDGERWDFGGSRPEGTPHCCATVIEHVKDCLQGLIVGAVTNVI